MNVLQALLDELYMKQSFSAGITKLNLVTSLKSLKVKIIVH